MGSIVIKILLAIVGGLAGGWMLFDGIHVMLRGKYFGPEKPGPWSAIFRAMGVNPFSLGPLFILFGVLWLTFLVAILAGQSWARPAGVILAVATLWYLPLGTVLSVVYIVLVWFSRS